MKQAGWTVRAAGIGLLLGGAIICGLIAPAAAAEDDKHAAGKAADVTPRLWRKQGTITLSGRKITYEARAGTLILKDESGQPEAEIFHIAYVQKGAKPERRPITFLWNGGPGSASLWLHMGAFGSKRVVAPSDARDDGGPPYPIVDNPASLLDVTDLVFVDPVGTGFSRALGRHKDEDFYGIEADAKAMARFIRRFLSLSGRWNSPKFIGGESYGTTRTAAVVHELEGGVDDVAVNGLILISTILDFSARAEVPGNEMAYVILLPTMAATAWYHGKVSPRPPLETFLAEARRFAAGPYLQALMKGTALAEPERSRIRKRLAYFTGLSETYLDRAHLRVGLFRYMKELLRDRGLVVGRLDSRYTGRDADDAGERPEMDPAFYGIDGIYTAAINHYLRRNLGVDWEREYRTIKGLGPRWNWKLSDMRRPFYLNLAPFIGQALRQNRDLGVFVAAGWYDFATPFFGAELALSRPGIPQDRIAFHYYPAGHMMYVEEGSLARLAEDLRRFIRAHTHPPQP